MLKKSNQVNQIYSVEEVIETLERPWAEDLISKDSKPSNTTTTWFLKKTSGSKEKEIWSIITSNRNGRKSSQIFRNAKANTVFNNKNQTPENMEHIK